MTLSISDLISWNVGLQMINIGLTRTLQSIIKCMFFIGSPKVSRQAIGNLANYGFLSLPCQTSKSLSHIEKFVKLLKSWDIFENNSFFFSSLVAVFFALLVHPGSKNTTLLRKCIRWKILYSDPYIAGMPKSTISIKFPWSCKPLLFEN